MFGIKNSYIAVLGIAIAAFIILGLLIPHGSSGDDSALLKGNITADVNGHLTNGTHVVIDHKVYPVVKKPETEEKSSNDESATANDTTQPEVLVYSITDFKDWTNGKLSITTDANDIEVFSSVDNAQELVDNVWDENFDKKWNVDHAAVQFANEYGDDDPVKSIFFTSNDMFVVTKKTSGIGPQVWSPDKDGKLQKVTSGKKNVYGLDRVSKTA